MGAGTSPADPASAGPQSAEPQSAAGPGAGGTADADEAAGTGEAPGPVKAAVPGEGAGNVAGSTRRFPSLTRDTARPEGGGRAAPGDAPAPARQWPLLVVLCTVGVGLLIVAADPFAEAFRVGAILIGVALLVGAVLRWAVPSVGMLAVRSRFTDLVTYGLMGVLIVLLALMAQPNPLLDVPILQDVVHFTIR